MTQSSLHETSFWPFLLFTSPRPLAARMKAELGAEHLQPAGPCGPASWLRGRGCVAALCVIAWAEPEAPGCELRAVSSQEGHPARRVGLGSLTVRHQPERSPRERNGWMRNTQGPNSYLKKLTQVVQRGGCETEATAQGPASLTRCKRCKRCPSSRREGSTGLR